VRTAALGLALLLLASCASTTGAAPTSSASATPTASASLSAATGTATTATTLQCSPPAQALVELTEGPYYKAGAPQRASLLASGVPGTPLVLSGFVVTRSCRPVANAKLDFWQADGSGNYDNSGYTLRGWQLAAADGSYRLETVIPGLYPGRTEHIHVKVTPPGGATATSQLFFPGVSQNASDGIFSTAMLVRLDASKTPAAATFTFVVDQP
jgi:protocatechuate 3,4-dioxygenase beta subunit